MELARSLTYGFHIVGFCYPNMNLCPKRHCFLFFMLTFDVDLWSYIFYTQKVADRFCVWILQFVLTRIKYGPARYWAILFVFWFLVFGIWASRTHGAHTTWLHLLLCCLCFLIKVFCFFFGNIFLFISLMERTFFWTLLRWRQKVMADCAKFLSLDTSWMHCNGQLL